MELGEQPVDAPEVLGWNESPLSWEQVSVLNRSATPDKPDPTGYRSRESKRWAHIPDVDVYTSVLGRVGCPELFSWSEPFSVSHASSVGRFFLLLSPVGLVLYDALFAALGEETSQDAASTVGGNMCVVQNEKRTSSLLSAFIFSR